MQVIIFEGIPTSGKTSTIEEFKKLLNNNFEIIYEDEILMQILKNKDPGIALEHLKSFRIRIENCKKKRSNY